MASERLGLSIGWRPTNQSWPKIGPLGDSFNLFPTIALCLTYRIVKRQRAG